MSKASVIQVRVTSNLKARSERRAEELGFNSVQEAIRVFLSSFSTGLVRPGIVHEASGISEGVVLSSSAKKRLSQIVRDLNKGKNVRKFSDPQKALSWLNE